MNEENDKTENSEIKKSVVLKYPENAPAPFITASGKKQLAEKILKIAEENNIPVVENSEMADVLCMEEIGSYIPEETWEIMAMIFSNLVDFEKK